jgi:hypothetical protein
MSTLNFSANGQSKQSIKTERKDGMTLVSVEQIKVANQAHIELKALRIYTEKLDSICEHYKQSSIEFRRANELCAEVIKNDSILLENSGQILTIRERELKEARRELKKQKQKTWVGVGVAAAIALVALIL